jgi:glycosyltransferase involved in cell wall biosynthesis
MRLACFTPLPPVSSGIADYSLSLVEALASDHELDVYVASAAEVEAWSGRDPRVDVRNAHDFSWHHRARRHDLIVYQIGNAWCHDYTWPYLFRYPGLVVLHDAQLHHARAWSLLRRQREDDYRSELLFSHPTLPPEAAELALSGFSGPLYYFWPMLRAVVNAARLVAVHNQRLAGDLKREFSTAEVVTITMGMPMSAPTPAATAAVRARHGIPPDAVIVAAFGGVSEEKRLGPLLRATAVARRYQPALRVLLVGQVLPHYDVMAEAREAGVADLVTCTGYVAESDVDAYLHAADVVSCLRWPSARETSASWLRAIAAGRATIVTDLAQLADVPTLDPRSWTLLRASAAQTDPAPVAVSIDVMDEEHSLRLALKRLVSDAPLRATLGRHAAAYCRAHHARDRMFADYDRALTRAAAAPLPQAPLPEHLRSDGLEHTREILALFGGSISPPLP